MGPTISWGKNIIKSEYLLILFFSIFPSKQSTKRAIVWKVTNLKSSGKGRFNNSKFKLNIMFTLLITKSAYLKKPRYKILKIIEIIRIFFL